MDMRCLTPPDRVADVDDICLFYGFFDGLQIRNFRAHTALGRGRCRFVFSCYAAVVISIIEVILRIRVCGFYLDDFPFWFPADPFCSSFCRACRRKIKNGNFFPACFCFCLYAGCSYVCKGYCLCFSIPFILCDTFELIVSWLFTNRLWVSYRTISFLFYPPSVMIYKTEIWEKSRFAYEVYTIRL